MIGTIFRSATLRATGWKMLSSVARLAFCNDGKKPIKGMHVPDHVGFEKYQRNRKEMPQNKEKTSPQHRTKTKGHQSTDSSTGVNNEAPVEKPSTDQPQQPSQPEQPTVENQHMRQLVFLVNELDDMELSIAVLKQRFEKIKSSKQESIMKVMQAQEVKQAGLTLSQLTNEVQNIRNVIKEVEQKIKSGEGLDDEEIRSVPKALKNLRSMVYKLKNDLTDRGQVINPIYEGMALQEDSKLHRLRYDSSSRRTKSKPKKEGSTQKQEQEEDEDKISKKFNWKYVKAFLLESGESLKEVAIDIFTFLKARFRTYYLVLLGVAIALFPTEKYYSEQELFSMLEDQNKVTNIKLVTVEERSSSYQMLSFEVDGQKGYLFVENINLLLEKLRQRYPNMPINPEKKTALERKAEFLQQISKVGYMYGLLAIYGILLYKLSKNAGGGMGGNPLGDKVGKQRFDMTKQTNVKFASVAGLKQSKFEIEEFVDFLKNPERYQQLGARIPKGALLTGPPGTGKTMLAKATAGEAGVPFFFVSGSDFVEIYVGVGASRVRDLFKEAKANSPAIIFIDEIDAIGKKRQSSINSNSEKDGTLNQLLVEMDGFGTDNRVIVMAATNQKDMLDNALTRPGRFDRIIEVNLPDLEGRKEIFMVHLKPLKLSKEQSMEEYANRLATLTPGFSGAEISNLCNQAAITAARANKQFVDPFDFEMATERVIGGVNRRSIMSKEEREVVAVHESGHAVVSWFLEGAYPLLKLTIIPRSKGSLGFAQYLPSETRLETKEQLLDRICFILGGRVAEQHFFKRVTTGAADDLQKAYRIAHDLVTKYGMSEKVGYIGYRDGSYLKQYSKNMAVLIDQEVRAIITRCTQITRQMVSKHSHQIRKLSDRLLQKQTLDGKQIREILGERPFAPHSGYKAYLELESKLKEASSTPSL